MSFKKMDEESASSIIGGSYVPGRGYSSGDWNIISGSKIGCEDHYGKGRCYQGKDGKWYGSGGRF